MWAYSRVSRLPRRPEVLNFLELELQAVVSHLVWMLATELRFLGRAPALEVIFKQKTDFRIEL